MYQPWKHILILNTTIQLTHNAGYGHAYDFSTNAITPE